MPGKIYDFIRARIEQGYKSVETPSDFVTVAHHVVRSEINYLKATIDMRTEQEKQDDL